MITDEFECILTAAMRYSLGRQTYMPSVVVDYITPLISELSDKFLYVAMRDIDEQRERGEKAWKKHQGFNKFRIKANPRYFGRPKGALR